MDSTLEQELFGDVDISSDFLSVLADNLPLDTSQSAFYPYNLEDGELPSYFQQEPELAKRPSSSESESDTPSSKHSQEQVHRETSSDHASESAVPMHSIQGQSYSNDILNHFDDPAIPLSIIDQSIWPFQNELQSALEQAYELHRRTKRADLSIVETQSRQNFRSSTVPSQLDTRHEIVDGDLVSVQGRTLEQAQDLSPIAQPHRVAKRAKSTRMEARITFNPAKYYLPLPSVPSPWGPLGKNGAHLFHYRSNGELHPSIVLTTRQIQDYIRLHPLNYTRNPTEAPTPNTKKSGLIIWIQCVPADSAHRYDNMHSNKCRFRECPEPHRTILKGDFRVAFDEQSSSFPQVDPFHNAGYVHLYCMERFCDFPSIARAYNVKPDDRKILPEGESKMALNRDHDDMVDVAQEYLSSFEWPPVGRPQDPEDAYIETLNYKLTEHHLNLLPPTKRAARDARGSMNSLDIHMNNLEIFVHNRALRNATKKSRASRTGKRKLGSVVEEDVISNEFEARDAAFPTNRSKRAKVSDGRSGYTR